MSISPLPPAPQTTDPANFDTRADALIAALPTFIDECNATAAAMALNDTNGTSSTSVLIGTGSKTFTASTAKSWQLGMTLRIASTASPTNFMTGEVTAYNTGTGSLTVNVTNTSGSGTLASWTISQAGVSLQAPVIDMTGYSGADVALGVGQSAIYDVTAASSILLRIATGNNQEYELTINPDYTASATAGINVVLLQNNAVLGGNTIIQQFLYGTVTTPTTNGQTGNSYLIGLTHSLHKLKCWISTKTTSKNTISHFLNRNGATASFFGGVGSANPDTTTAWTSLGTISCNAITGRIMVTRVM